MHGIEDALLWVGRLDERLRGDPLFPAWQRRNAVTAATRMVETDGRKVQADRLAALLAGLPLRHLADEGAERDALHLLERISIAYRGDIDPDVGDALEYMQENRGRRTRLEDAVGGMLNYVRVGGSREAARLALPILLCDRGIVRAGYLPALSATGAFSAADGDDAVDVGIRDLGRSAVRAIDDFIELKRQWRSWRARVSHKRGHSRMPALVDLIAARQAVTPTLVAAALGLSLAGAGRMLDEAAELGIVRNITRRQTWRVYVAQDLRVDDDVERLRPVTAWTSRASEPDGDDHDDGLPNDMPDDLRAPPAPVVRRRGSPLPAIEEDPAPTDGLDVILAETDRAIRRSAAAIERARGRRAIGAFATDAPAAVDVEADTLPV